MQKKIFIFLFVLCEVLSLSFSVQAKTSQDRIFAVIKAAQENLLDQRMQDGLWDFPSFLGIFYVSQYYLVRKWLNLPENEEQAEILKNYILKSQLSDGSWYAVKDESIKNEGDINATLWNYLALKAMKITDESVCERAKVFILKAGGIEKSNALSKILLATMGLYNWDHLPKIPLSILNENSFVNLNKFGQWVGPHLKAMIFLRKFKLQKNMGLNSRSLFLDSFTEVFGSEEKINEKQAQKIRNMILKDQQPAGSWGGYTEATLLSLMVLHKMGVANDENVFQKALRFIEGRYFFNKDGNYLGSTQDGRYWDSILAGQALLESGVAPIELEKTAKAILSQQTRSGGLPFGIDFEYAPDVDDTAEMILFLKSFKDFKGKMSIESITSINRALQWIEEMQNKDGGWAAFSKNNKGRFLINLFIKPFSDSVDFYDESSPDVTGHVLEAMGRTGMRVEQLDHVIFRAIKYLKQTQDKVLGAWFGRWGVNYIYGTSAVLIGLMSVKESSNEEYIRKAIDWLKSVQNEDGGYGESTLSYVSRDWAGKGVSTPSQTAWALMALIAVGEAKSETARKAVDFLVSFFEEQGKWVDPSVVGTGHPGIVYMEYPSYPFIFPLMALSRYNEQKFAYADEQAAELYSQPHEYHRKRQK